ncbi:hypothetical protein GE061_019307 [Apolygus lucorum]|uniref:Uncharacterized protein n=1 Tax=Apolygus lucorum TaxID=248454 RepID=A0A8S9X7R6_APOLU|nr:hypothetical protein GE061_019307 [Apolygus lucorum]
MNRLRSIKCTYVVVLFGISCLCHVIGVHVKASTDLNSLHINDSQLFKPQPLGAFSRPPIGITNQSKFIQSDLSQQNTSNKNDIRNSTLSENISPPHKSEVELTSKNIHIPEEDKSLVKPNSTEYSEAINTQTDDDDGKGKFWTRLPLLRDTFKYLVTDFYPEKILNSLSNRFGYSNQTKTSDGVKPSVVYPLVMEGVSVLLNRFLENGDSESTEGSQGAIRGRIANTMTESIGELLRNNIVESGTVNQDESGKSSADDEDFSGLDLETVKSLLPLIQTAQSNGDLSDVMSKILKNPSHEFGDLNNLLKNYSPQLTGILSNRKVLEVIAKQRLDQSNAVNLTSIMEQFIPNNGEVGEDGMSPKNPLLRSEFVSKILAKSPVAHLGALDDSIKRLVTSSLERAVSRVKIDQNGQIHMSDGMKKMVNKMLENSDSTTTAAQRWTPSMGYSELSSSRHPSL